MFGRDRKDDKKKPGSRAPRVTGGSVSPVPKVDLGESDRDAEEKALRPLWNEMSRRRLLTDHGIDEDIMKMRGSADTLVDHLTEARDKLPAASSLDEPLEDLVDAVNRFRTRMGTEITSFEDYREFLMHLREDVQAGVLAVNNILPLPNGKRLFDKIDPGAAKYGDLTFDPEPEGGQPLPP
jgi:hypothetical protein